MANFNVSVTQSNEPQPSGIGAGDSTTYTISNPLPGSSYFTLETVQNSNGAYDSNSPKNLQGTLSGDSGITNIVSDDYKAGIVVSPGGGVLTFVPTNAITAATLRLRGTSPGFVSTTPLDADYQAVLDRASTLGYRAPNAAQQTLQNTLVEDLKTAGIWSKLDVFYVFATDGDNDYATLNWKSPSNNEATKVNSPTFTDNIGFTGNGSSAYLDTNFQPVNGSQYTTNSASFGVYSQSDLSVAANYYPVATAAKSRLKRTNIASGDNRINSLSPSPTISFNANTGLVGLNRPSSTQVQALQSDGTLGSLSTATAASIQVKNMFFLNYIDSSYSAAQISLGWAGGHFTSTEWSDYVTAVDNYLGAI
jgi:hypothetical protein